MIQDYKTIQIMKVEHLENPVFVPDEALKKIERRFYALVYLELFRAGYYRDDAYISGKQIELENLK